MDIIYNEIKSRNSSIINENGLLFDPLLLHKEQDKRLCLAIFSNINSLNLSDFYNDIETIIKSCIYYQSNSQCSYTTFEGNPKGELENNGTLHFTLLQILGFNDFKRLNDYSILEQIIPILKELLPLKITYKGIILTQCGIILRGYPDKDINIIRNKIRYALKDIIKEPYQNNSCHSTICRFTEKLNILNIKNLVDKYQDYDFGETTITSFNIGYGTWKLNNNEIDILFKI